MVKIHHLGASRSDRIIWLCEELSVPYKLVVHQRDPNTMRAPAEIWAINPLAKAPVIEDNGKAVFESGAIIEYLVETYGEGRFKPAKNAQAYIQYLHWMHCAESTLMTPILFGILSSAMGVESEILPLFIEGEYKTLFDYADAELAKHQYIAGEEFTAADIMVAYTLMMADQPPVGPGFAPGDGNSFVSPFVNYKNIQRYLGDIRARSAYQRAAKQF